MKSAIHYANEHHSHMSVHMCAHALTHSTASTDDVVLKKEYVHILSLSIPIPIYHPYTLPHLSHSLSPHSSRHTVV